MNRRLYEFDNFVIADGKPAVLDLSINRRAAALETPTAEVSVVLGQTALTAERLLSMEKGAVLTLNRELKDNIDIYVNGSMAAKGELMVENGKLGVVVTKVLKEENSCG